jgi:formate hydrogenlyase subunit 3/multisubunit Na+/H+ antiporter MnhD subunit
MTLALLAIYLPFFLSFVALWTRLETHGRQALMAAAIMPAVAAAAIGIAQDVSAPWLFLNAHFGLDVPRQIFLLFTSLLYLTAGLYAGAYLDTHRRQRVFVFLYLLTMSGNVGLILAEDIATFYTFFALMTFAAYGLVVFDGTSEAKRAGKVYMVMAVLGEAMILGALFLIVSEAPTLLLADAGEVVAASDYRNIMIALLLGGFGVKAGVVGLHMWLPLAHPVAPTPASAVLSGAMIKAGLLGWMHFLPMGAYDSEVWSVGIIVMGLTAALGAAAVGATQNEPKTILAYSSISQMGVMTMAVGVGLAEPTAWPVILPVIAVYAFSHSFAKGALFLGVGIAHAADTRNARYFTMAGLVVAAAAIAGAPLTGGAMVKKALYDVISFAPGTWPDLLEWMLLLSAVATTIILGRFLQVIWADVQKESEHRPHQSLWWSWTFSLALVAIGVWVAVPYYAIEVDLPRLALADAWDALWPVLLGAALLLGWWRFFSRYLPQVRIPAGDLLIPVAAVLRTAAETYRQASIPGPSTWEINFEPLVEGLVENERKRAIMSRIERALMRWDVAGLWFLVLILVIAGLMWLER